LRPSCKPSSPATGAARLSADPGMSVPEIRHPGLADYGLLVLLSLLWGSSFIAIKIAVEHAMPPMTLALLRIAIGAAMLLAIARARDQAWPSFAGLGLWGRILFLGVVGNALPFFLIGWGEQSTTSQLAGIRMAVIPLMVVILAHFFTADERLRLPKLIGVLLGFAGVVVLVGADLRGGDLLAALAVLAAAVGYVAGPLVIATRLRGVPPLGVITGAMLVAAVAYAVPALRTWPDDAAAVSSQAWASVVTLGVVCSALAFVVMFALIAEAGPARMSVITYVNPAVALLLGVAILDEPVTAGLVLGFGLILVGSWWGTSADHAAAEAVRADDVITEPAARP